MVFLWAMRSGVIEVLCAWCVGDMGLCLSVNDELDLLRRHRGPQLTSTINEVSRSRSNKYLPYSPLHVKYLYPLTKPGLLQENRRTPLVVPDHFQDDRRLAL